MDFVNINNNHYGVNEDYGFFRWFESIFGELFVNINQSH